MLAIRVFKRQWMLFAGIIPIPFCEVCGGSQETASTSASERQPNPLNQVNSVDGLKKLFRGWVDSVTGIIRNLSGHLPHLPDYPVTASASVSAFTEGQFDPRGMGQVGSGKGLDEVSAHISAIGEAIERYSAARFDKSELKYASISPKAFRLRHGAGNRKFTGPEGSGWVPTSASGYQRWSAISISTVLRGCTESYWTQTQYMDVGSNCLTESRIMEVSPVVFCAMYPSDLTDAEWQILAPFFS